MMDAGTSVNGGAYMDFKEATDGLLSSVHQEQLAKALGVSVASIRQARLRADAHAHRRPPEEWKYAVIRLAEERVWHYRRLIESLRNSVGENT